MSFTFDGANKLIICDPGVTAFTAFLEGLEADFPNRVDLVYGARRESLMLYRELVLDRLRVVRRFRAWLSVEEAGDVRPATVVPPEAAGRLAVTTCVLVNLGVAREDLSPAHWTYFYDRDVCFTRISYPHMFSPGNVPPGTGSIQVELY